MALCELYGEFTVDLSICGCLQQSREWNSSAHLPRFGLSFNQINYILDSGLFQAKFLLMESSVFNTGT